MSTTLKRAAPKGRDEDNPLPLSADPREAGRREEFCRLVVEGQHTLMVCYREAYREVLPPDLPASRVFERCKRLSADVGVAKRVQALRDEAARQTVTSVAQLLQDYLDIATADPNELISSRIDCCRFCHGIGHQYEYESETAYLNACAAAASSKVPGPPPECGGLSFRPDREPNPACPHCFGRGVAVQLLRDTTRLTAKARKLYAGVKVTKDGVQVLMHSQMDAREKIGRILGAFKVDGSGWAPPAAPVEPAADGKPVDPARAYLSLVGKG